jgi:serine protease Do
MNVKRILIPLAARLAAIACLLLTGPRTLAQAVPAFLEPAEQAVFMIVGDGGVGTGFLIRADGLAVTAYHVVAPSKEASAILPGREPVEIAGVVAVDPIRDTALIRLKGSGFPFAPIGTADKLGPGEAVWSFGFPFGQGMAVSKGQVLARPPAPGTAGHLQVTCELHNGMSGGPVFDRRGRVIGTGSQAGLSGTSLPWMA